MVCIREVQKDLKESAKLLIEDKLQQFNVGTADGFRVWKDRIETPKDGLIIFKGMQDYTAESIKSLEGFHRAWAEEAQTLTARSLSMLRPTIRKEGSEIWASWNPRRKTDAVDEFLRAKKPDNAAVIQANWKDNPWFPKVLSDERATDLKLYPERCGHIWDGEYAAAFEGAYFAGLLAAARSANPSRIGRVAADPLLPLRAFIDIGGSGATADAFTIWIVQWVGQEIRILDYYEAVGQVLAFHVNWLRSKGYQDAIIYLPHDGVNENNITGKRYEDHLRESGFSVEPPVKNQGRGAAMMRVEALRRLGPQLWWNEATTEPGRDAIGFYHERKDEARNVGLGPDHDWSSHAADALGLMAICYEDPSRMASFNRPIRYANVGVA
jgi:phage terminase large subunit